MDNATDYEDLIARADVKELMGKGSECLHLLKIAARERPDQGEPWTRIARIHIAANDIESARDAIDEGLEKCPGHAELHVESGIAHLMEGVLMEAADDFDRAIELDENCAGAWAELGTIFLAQEELDKAAEVLGRAAELAPDRPEFRYQLAMVQLSRGDVDAAKLSLLKIETHLPDSPSVHMDLGVMEMTAGRYGEALARFDALLKVDPINVRAKFYRYVALGHLVKLVEFHKAEGSDVEARQ